MRNFKYNLLQMMSDDLFVIPLCIGIALRLAVILQSNFPINDGGMFYTMIGELVNNGFKLPLTTAYNLSNIPFAYPPFAFYVVGIIHSISDISIIQLLRFIPLINTIICMFIFYLLSRTWLSKQESFFAILVFSLLPRSFEWEIMGGGVTRSFGMLFFLFTIYAFTKSVKPKPVDEILTGLFLGLTILSHLEWTALSFITLLLISLFKHKKLTSLMGVFMIAAVASSVWWINMLLNHGLSPFLAFLGNGVTPAVANASPQVLLLHITDEPFLTVLGVVAVLGLIYKIVNKDWLIPSLYLFPILLSQRSAPNLASIPLSMLAGIGFNQIFQKILLANNGSKRRRNILIAGITLYSMMSLVSLLFFKHMFAFYFDSLSADQRQTMMWVKANTVKESKFLLLTNRPDWNWSSDNELEWFPALSERKSISTPQGMEWIANSFNEKANLYAEIKWCYSENINCLQNVAEKYGENYDYIYVQKATEGNDSTALMEYQLEQSPDYKLVYDKDWAKIFKKV